MNWKKQLVSFVLIFLLVGALFSGRGACMRQQARAPIRPADARLETITLADRPGYLSDRSYQILCEVADTSQKKRRGLAGRPGLEPGYGMLYVYDPPQKPEFSEAETGFELSIAFLKADGTIAKIQKMKKNDRSVITADEPVAYVLEVRSGWFEDRNVEVGDRFILPAALSASERAPETQTDAPRAAPAPSG